MLHHLGSGTGRIVQKLLEVEPNMTILTVQAVLQRLFIRSSILTVQMIHTYAKKIDDN